MCLVWEMNSIKSQSCVYNMNFLPFFVGGLYCKTGFAYMTEAISSSTRFVGYTILYQWFSTKFFQQKLCPKFNFGDFHSLLYLFKSKNIFGHDSWFFIVTSVKTNARKEVTRIGEKIYFYMWFWLWYLPPIFSVYMSSSSKCYPNMTRLGNITSAEDCLMVCIINHENHILTFNF